MLLIINAKRYADMKTGMNVLELLSYLNLPKEKIAVERNKEIVPKSGYDTVILQDGDILEIITFIGGG